MRTSAALALVLPFAAGACESPPDELGGLETEQTAHALSVQDYYDPSGNFTVRVKTCDWSAAKANPWTSCSVDSEYALIGGGAEVEGNGPMSLLTTSYPTGLDTWLAISKDHMVSNPHRLRAYAVGLRVWGLSGNDLKARMRYVVAVSPRSQRPSIDVSVPPGFFAVGGGGWIRYNGEGVLLTESYSPDNLFKWRASGKDHVKYDTADIAVAAIGLPACLDNFCFSFRTDAASSFVNTGASAASVSTPWPYIPASVAGQAQSNGHGRLLTKQVPFTNWGGAGGWVQSKDHQLASSGWTTVWIKSIKTYTP